MSATLAGPALAQRDHIADLILIHAVYGGREGTVVTSEDRDSEAYLDCQTAAEAVIDMIAAPPAAVPASVARQKVAAMLRRQAEHEADHAQGALAVTIPTIVRDPEVQAYIDSKNRRNAYFDYVAALIEEQMPLEKIRTLPSADADARAYVGALLHLIAEEAPATEHAEETGDRIEDTDSRYNDTEPHYTCTSGGCNGEPGPCWVPGN